MFPQEPRNYYNIIYHNVIANSGIIHQGYFTTSGSLKESLSLRGNELLDEIAPKLGVNYKRIGALFCATTSNETKTLVGEFKKSKNRKVSVEYIEDPKKIQELEPLLKKSIIAVLHFPRSGIIVPWELTIALAEHAVLNGVKLELKFQVGYIEHSNDYYSLYSTDGKKIDVRTIINAAGLYSDKIANMVGDSSFNIYQSKGEYIMFDKNSLPLRKILFPTPSVVSKGIVIGPTLHGNFYVGPNAQEIEFKDGTFTTPQGLNEVLTGGMKLVDLPLRKHITNFAGLRAFTLKHDFIIESSKVVPQFLHAAGIDSPGLSSCLAIAERIEYLLEKDCGYVFNKNLEYNEILDQQQRFPDLSNVELAKKIQDNSQWGNIICRCEHVTEAEIVEACHRPIPCTNTDMIKRRLRPGMGRCQGGFCLAKVMKIISRERKIIYEKITKSGGRSYIVFERSKKLRSQVFKGDYI